MIREGYRFDAHGNLVESDVVLVWGPPASGKTRYVREHKGPVDLVLDLDLIKQALSMDQTGRAVSDGLVSVALNVRDHLYGLIADRRFRCDTVWVIAGVPTRAERDALCARIRATRLVRIEATEAECMERAFADDERADKDLQAQVISRWFREFYYD